MAQEVGKGHDFPSPCTFEYRLIFHVVCDNLSPVYKKRHVQMFLPKCALLLLFIAISLFVTYMKEGFHTHIRHRRITTSVQRIFSCRWQWFLNHPHQAYNIISDSHNKFYTFTNKKIQNRVQNTWCHYEVYRMLYVFFWVIPRRLNFICRRLGTLCLFHLPRQVG
jgi:hypothetical protein